MQLARQWTYRGLVMHPKEWEGWVAGWRTRRDWCWQAGPPLATDWKSGGAGVVADTKSGGVGGRRLSAAMGVTQMAEGAA